LGAFINESEWVFFFLSFFRNLHDSLHDWLLHFKEWLCQVSSVWI
jgi:hypothetical protein